MITNSEQVTADERAVVTLSEPDPAWPDVFGRERHRLNSIGTFTRIAPVGSTAVPSLRAKPIIDIMAAVEALADVDALLPELDRNDYALAEVGFRKRRLLRKLQMQDGVGYHLHIVTNAAWPHATELFVRDWLIAHPEDAARYQALKEALAQRHPNDMAAYTEGKSALLRTGAADAVGIVTRPIPSGARGPYRAARH